MGVKRNDPLLIGCARHVRTRLPSWDKPHFYYWYYGTLAMFQMGGGFWKEWNAALRDMLIKNQRRGGDEDGSWDPKSFYGQFGGRAYSTALGALCLEVYYRYLPMYEKN